MRSIPPPRATALLPRNGQSHRIHSMDRLLGMCERGHSTHREGYSVEYDPASEASTGALPNASSGPRPQRKKKVAALLRAPRGKNIVALQPRERNWLFGGVPSGLRIPGQRKYPALQVPIETKSKSQSRSGSHIDPAAIDCLPCAVLLLACCACPSLRVPPSPISLSHHRLVGIVNFQPSNL